MQHCSGTELDKVPTKTSPSNQQPYLKHHTLVINAMAPLSLGVSCPSPPRLFENQTSVRPLLPQHRCTAPRKYIAKRHITLATAQQCVATPISPAAAACAALLWPVTQLMCAVRQAFSKLVKDVDMEARFISCLCSAVHHHDVSRRTWPFKPRCCTSSSRSTGWCSHLPQYLVPPTHSSWSARRSAALSRWVPLKIVRPLFPTHCLPQLYLLLLFVRVLLSWFPNFSWENQPWLALRQVRTLPNRRHSPNRCVHRSPIPTSTCFVGLCHR